MFLTSCGNPILQTNVFFFPDLAVMSGVVFYVALIFGQFLCVTGQGCPSRCTCHKAIVNCHGKKLERVPRNLPMSIERLILSQNHIEEISRDDFCTLPNLVEIQLQNNKISSIPSHTFTGECIPNIQSIRLENNKINVTEAGAFYNLSALVNVTLINNKLSQLHPNSFDGTTLKFLHLGSNKLKNIPNLRNLDVLEMLIMEGNEIQNGTFPHFFRTMLNMTTIGLSNNKISNLDKDVFSNLKYSKIRKLELARNNITKISNESFLPLSALQSLKLGWNPLTDDELYKALSGLLGAPLTSLSIPGLQFNGLMPSSSFPLLKNANLSTLDMSFNEINNIPPYGFKTLTQLRSLEISNCGIRFIHENAFDGLKNLNNLLLTNNYIQSVPRNLPKSLLYLYMTGNQVDVLKTNSFSNLGSLRRLYLGHNKILTLFQGAFVGLHNLKDLQLYGNRINTLPKRLFAPLSSLVSLELQENNLKMIQNSTDTFSSMISLEYLNLADNDCSFLPVTLFAKLNKSMQTLKLQGNRLGKYFLDDNEGKLFAGLKQLKFLDLSSNQIHTFPSSLFRDMDSLENLSLRDNWISGWKGNSLSLSSSLHYLDLSNNRIAIIGEETMKGMQSLKTVNFTNNPFACTCDLRWFRKWIRSTNTTISSVEKYQCNSPLEWKGKPLLSFDETKIECNLVALTTTIGIVLGVTGLTFAIAFAMYWYRLYIIFLWFLIKKRLCSIRRKGYEEILHWEYDACIVYSEMQEDSVWIQENILHNFDRGTEDDDNQGAYKIYFDDRDTLGSALKLDTMMNVMEKSRKIIIVITKNTTSDHLMNILIFETLILKRDSLHDIIVVTKDKLSISDIPRLLHSTFIIGDNVEWRDKAIYKKVFMAKMKEKLEDPILEYEDEA